MKKILIFSAIFAVVVAFCINYIIKDVGTKFQEEKSKVESKLGQKVVLERDTLKIIDYSIIYQNYTLSNGQKISFELVKNLEVIK